MNLQIQVFQYVTPCLFLGYFIYSGGGGDVDTIVFRNVGVSRTKRCTIPIKIRKFRSIAGRKTNLASYMNLLRDVNLQECALPANFAKCSSIHLSLDINCC